MSESQSARLIVKIATGSCEPLRALIVLAFVCGIVVANACAQQTSPAPLSPSAPASPAAQSAAAKIKLNGEDVGTTADTSVLVRRFTEIFDQRPRKIGNFFIRAENDLRFSEVIRVAEALSHAHGIAELAFEVNPASVRRVTGDPVINGDHFPRSMMLVVTVGNLGSARGELISGGIFLKLTGFTIPFAPRHDLPKEFVVVEVFRDNEYVIADKPIPSSALRSELQARLSKTQDKRVMVLTRSDSEIRWGSFMEVVNAAREAGAEMIQILTLTP
jgi:biopolymer transport protein ExbD